MIKQLFSSLRTLTANKGRLLLTLLGISVGVAAVIITVTISSVGKTMLNREIDGLGMGGLSVTLNDHQAPLTEKELDNIKNMPFVSTASPLVFETTSIHFKDKYLPVYLWGIDQNAEGSISLSLVYGRFFNAGDIASDSKTCIVDEKFALTNYGTENITGKEILINSGNTSDKYEVVGIIKTGSGLLQNVMGSVIPDFIYIPYSTMQRNMASNNFTQIVVRTYDENYDSESKQLSERLSAFSSYKDAYAVSNLSRQKESLNSIIEIFSVVLSLIGGISLIVAGMNIMNVMLVAVRERTREIGIKKAIGASRSMIVAEFLTESAVISLSGGIIGIILGNAAVMTGGYILGLTIQPEMNIIWLMLIFSLVIGTIFGLYPAIKASMLKPVEALRYY